MSLNTEAQSLTEFIPSVMESSLSNGIIPPQSYSQAESLLRIISINKGQIPNIVISGSPSPAEVEEPLFLRRSGIQFPILSSSSPVFILPDSNMS